jgi:hypothetical protein
MYSVEERIFVLAYSRTSSSFRQITKVLVERRGFEISHSAIHDFVRKHGATQTPMKSGGAEESTAMIAPRPNPEWHGADPSIRDRIEALKTSEAGPGGRGDRLPLRSRQAASPGRIAVLSSCEKRWSVW